MKIYKKIGVAIFIILGLLFILATWYKYAFSMDEAESMEINSSHFENKIFMATQGSDFKDLITYSIIDHYKSKPIFLKVIDIELLADVDPQKYDAIIVIHTWENWKPPLVVKNFIEQAGLYKDKIVVLTTSGEGSYKMEGMDALAGESILQNAQEFSNTIINKVDIILANNKKAKD